jgi:serine/threonine-protein kinase
MATIQDSQPTLQIEGNGGDGLIKASPDPEADGSCNTGSVLKRIFCPTHGMMGGANQQLASETQTILHSRILAVSLIFLACLILFSVRGFLVEGFFTLEQVVVGILFASSALYLKYVRQPSIVKLRMMELFVFGTMLVHLLVINSTNILSLSVQATLTHLPSGIYRAAISFFALIVVYGMFIPNNWRRAAVVIAGIAVTPALFATVLWVGYPKLRVALSPVLSTQDVSFTALFILGGSVISVIGAHLVDTMRTNTARMRETGMYQLKEKIGSGGMGEVWKAEHRLLARPAAIKMIRSDVLAANGNGQADSLVRRFHREARITASLRSPHTVELYDFGNTLAGTFYYVMEYLQGFDLETLVEKFGPLPPERATYIIKQAADSLSEAHRKGLIHRDIKPSNIHIGKMGTYDDFAKVLDFGLVKAIPQLDTDEMKLTAEGTTTGTPAFMAPEVALGKSEIDARSDIYALGCVLYWLVTGMLVFEGETPMEIVVNHVKNAPIPPSQRSEFEIPECLDQTILACLSKDPDARPQSMTELGEMLDACRLARGWTGEKAESWWQAHAPERLV